MVKQLITHAELSGRVPSWDHKHFPTTNLVNPAALDEKTDFYVSSEGSNRSRVTGITLSDY